MVEWGKQQQNITTDKAKRWLHACGRNPGGGTPLYHVTGRAALKGILFTHLTSLSGYPFAPFLKKVPKWVSFLQNLEEKSPRWYPFYKILRKESLSGYQILP